MIGDSVLLDTNAAIDLMHRERRIAYALEGIERVHLPTDGIGGVGMRSLQVASPPDEPGVDLEAPERSGAAPSGSRDGGDLRRTHGRPSREGATDPGERRLDRGGGGSALLAPSHARRPLPERGNAPDHRMVTPA